MFAKELGSIDAGITPPDFGPIMRFYALTTTDESSIAAAVIAIREDLILLLLKTALIDQFVEIKE